MSKRPLQSVKPLVRPAGQSEPTVPAKKSCSVQQTASSSTAASPVIVNRSDQASGHGLNLKGAEHDEPCTSNGSGTKTYQWQCKDEESIQWNDFEDDKGEAIERNYCQVDCEQCEVFLSTKGNTSEQPNCREAGILFFDNDNKFQIMSMIFPESGMSMQVRRISAPSSVENSSSGVVTIWNWYWFDKNNNTWIQYGSEYNTNSKLSLTDQAVEDIELAFLTSTGHYRLGSSPTLYLDFSTMMQKDTNLKAETKIRRRPVFIEPKSKAKELEAARRIDQNEDQPKRFQRPEYWTNEGDDHLVQYVKVDKNEADYIFLENGFKATMPRTVTSITRVQNLEVYEAFDRKRVWMKKKNNNEDPKKLFLFHGTSASTVKAICEQGFDCRISGSKTGTVHGKGTYFAVNAVMAAQYADNKSMFVCKVLVGDSCKGNKKFVRPPPKDPRKPNENFYDSCVDNPQNPGMYVIFKPEQAYPEYIIKYK